MIPNNSKEISDKELLEECLNGKEWAWEIFHKRFSPIISSVAKRASIRYPSSLTQEDISDCKQYIWGSFIEKGYDTLRRWEERCSLATWIRVCGFKAAGKYFRTVLKAPPFISIEETPPLSIVEKLPSTLNPLDGVIRQELLDKTKYIIENRLSDREKFFGKLFWLKGFSFKEISRTMNISLENAYLIKHRIEMKIKRSLNERFDKMIK